VIARNSDIGRKAQNLLIDTASSGDPLTKDAPSGRLDMMREEIAGENPTPLEVLLTERVVSCWMLVQPSDMPMVAQMWKETPKENRVPLSYLKHMTRWQESATRTARSSGHKGARQGEEAAGGGATDPGEYAG
jgi:hypothetical protein